jgi:hypothetical protein
MPESPAGSGAASQIDAPGSCEGPDGYRGDHSRPSDVYLTADIPGWARLNRSQSVYMVSPLGRLEVQLMELSGLHPDVAVYRRDDWLKPGGEVNQLIADAATDFG